MHRVWRRKLFREEAGERRGEKRSLLVRQRLPFLRLLLPLLRRGGHFVVVVFARRFLWEQSRAGWCGAVRCCAVRLFCVYSAQALSYFPHCLSSAVLVWSGKGAKVKYLSFQHLFFFFYLQTAGDAHRDYTQGRRRTQRERERHNVRLPYATLRLFLSLSLNALGGRGYTGG